MTTFIFVHGAMHGSWCWDLVVEPLLDVGHQVYTVDMPGRAGHAPPRDVTQQSYVDELTAAIDACEEPVTLVVHSLGGIAASVAADQRTAAIRRMIFVNSLLLQDGDHALQAMHRGGPDCVLTRPGALVFSADEATISVENAATAVEAFYNRTDPAVAAEAIAKLVPEPLSPALQPVTLTQAGFGSVAKSYIGSRYDRSIPWPLQIAMCRSYGLDIVELGGDHSPFLSVPNDLASVLDEMA